MCIVVCLHQVNVRDRDGVSRQERELNTAKAFATQHDLDGKSISVPCRTNAERHAAARVYSNNATLQTPRGLAVNRSKAPEAQIGAEDSKTFSNFAYCQVVAPALQVESLAEVRKGDL
eukprot:scaffold38945_cov21-Prasinocladus_malaysianus.AAC.1